MWLNLGLILGCRGEATPSVYHLGGSLVRLDLGDMLIKVVWVDDMCNKCIGSQRCLRNREGGERRRDFTFCKSVRGYSP